MVAGIKIFELKNIPFEILSLVVEEAVLLDNTSPYTFKKSKN